MKINLNKQTGSVTELELAKANRIPNLSITLGPDLVLNNSGNNSTLILTDKLWVSNEFNFVIFSGSSSK